MTKEEILNKALKPLFYLIIAGMVMAGCDSIDQNQQEFNIWIQKAKKPVFVHWQNKSRGIQTSDDCLLVDSSNNVLFLKECDMALPDTIR